MGIDDALLTFPSEDRKEYAFSSRNVVYELEAHAFVQRGSPEAALLGQRPGRETLQTMKICILSGDSWVRTFLTDSDVDFELASNLANCLHRIAIGRLDVLMQSAAAGQRAIAANDLQDKIVMLDHVYARIPFTLLVSKKRPDAKAFLKRFDMTVDDLKADGSLAALINDLGQ